MTAPSLRPALSAREFGLLVLSCVVLPCVDVGVRTIGIERTRSALAAVTRWASAQPSSVPIANYARSAAKMVAIAATRSPWRVSCLRRALWFEALMRRRGIPCEIHFGVAGAATRGQLRAHAWVVVEGEVMLGGESSPTEYSALR